jgi:type VI protein secretion system component VasK
MPMSLADSLRDRDLTEATYWSIIGVAGGYCVVTMVLVPLLALAAGGYLAVTQQYVIAIGLTVLGVVGAYWGYRRRMTDSEYTADTA